ncbi:MAG: murein L,D-transpeptidase YafK, partial [Parvicellaceae bacterium]
GDIFIHGNCVSIGCIPITNVMIEELYVLAVEARNNGQRKIPVHIFPFKMHDDNIKVATESLSDETIKSFWENLKGGYQKFEETRKVPTVKITSTGSYIYS